MDVWPGEVLVEGPVELRRRRVADAGVLYRNIDAAREHLVPWMPWAATQDFDETVAFLRKCEREWGSGDAFNYAIMTEGQDVGLISLMARIGDGGLEIGYWLVPEWTGKGLVSRAVVAVARQAFALPGIDRVEIHHDAANAPSAAVPKRLGFTEVGRIEQPPEAPGECGVHVMWRLEKQEFRE